ncbi:MAG: pyruvate dehydrogenase complex dihydrolipoamide acetyltransferase [Gemmatimonadetes bacterium]|nr:pyruvate dehydrogenase complex dihydrolipoamide acetyltransferase [Gemmatimonadota bacterium]
MATKVHMEALSPTMEEGQLVKWLKSEGDAISEGDVLAEIETDKATMELVARGSGVLQNITLKDGQTAPVGEVIAVIAAEGEEVEAKSGSGAAGVAKVDDAGSDDDADDDAAGDDALDDDARAGEDDDEARKPAAKQDRPGPGKEVPAKSREERGNGDVRVKASPLARRLAEESGVELSAVEGTGPGGRITKRDIEAAAQAGPSAKQGADAGAEPSAAAPAAAPRVARGPDTEEVPLTQMRKTIAKRLAQSIGPIPTFYLTIECDMTRTMELRERANRALEKEGVKASINDFIIKAVAVALARHPEVNASWGDSVIVRHHRVHIGVAVAVEDGLITPIVRDADAKRVRDIAVEVKELAGRAREKKLKPEEYTGATFSVSNLGMFGIVEFTAIINPPESGILAVGAVEEKVVVEDGEMVVRPRMRMTMSCDHRVVDGVMGAKFLQTLRELIEDPMMMIA